MEGDVLLDAAPAARHLASLSRPAEPAMSLSRQFLLLPQEIEGISLPPQVSGDRYGVVVLAVPHILESAAAPRPLPPVSLVRARWWGEDTAGSLFRPAVLSQGIEESRNLSGDPSPDRGSESPYSFSPRTIAMRYPIHVPAQQLLEYFQDMKLLKLDVIDRSTRKPYGCCSLSLQVSERVADMQPEEKLATLRKENALCEISSLAEDEEDAVLGYLAVDFDIQWEESDTVESMHSIQTAQTTPTGLTPNASQRRYQVATDEQRPVQHTAMQSGSSRSLSSSPSSFDDQRRRVANLSSGPTASARRSDAESGPRMVIEPPIHDSTSIQHLLEKGMALQRRMGQATAAPPVIEDDEAVVADPVASLDLSSLPSLSQRRNPATPCGINTIDDELADFGANLHPTAYSPQIDTTRQAHQANERLRNQPDSSTSSLESLELSFEQMEFERALIEQLRELRDPSSATSRFSPIKITVTHTEAVWTAPRSCDSSPLPVKYTEDFFVATSLRKRHWRLRNSSELPLGGPACTFGQRMQGADSDQMQLKFRVVCENQSDAERGERRRKRGLFPRPISSFVLVGSVDIQDLIEHVLDNEVWVARVALRLDDGPRGKSQVKTGNKVGSRQNSSSSGSLQVRFRLHQSSDEDRASDYSEADKETQLIRDESIDTAEDIQPGIAMSNESEVEPQVNTIKTTADHLQRANPHHRHKPVLSGVQNDTRYREQLQFAVMAETATVFDLSVAILQNQTSADVRTSNQADWPEFLTIQYSMPYHFSSRLSLVRKSEKLERQATRKLTHLAHGDSRLSARASYLGHVNIFSSKFHTDAADYFDRGIMILEVWTGTVEEQHAALVGIVKVSLARFGAFLRKSRLRSFIVAPLPFVGVEGTLPIENPFSGSTSGRIRLRLCIGTSEQILVLNSSIRGISAFQGVVRGALMRIRTGITRRIVPSPLNQLSGGADFGRDDDSERFTEMEAPFGKFNEKLEAPKSPEHRPTPAHDEVAKPQAFSTSDKVDDLKVRFDIRQSWCEAVQGVRDHSSSRATSSSTVLGCEIQAQLFLTRESQMKKEESSDSVTPFSLWWDGFDQKLNSFFAHMFPPLASGQETGWRGHITFSLRLECGTHGRNARSTVTGEADLDLKCVCRPCDTRNQGDMVVINVDVPIHWSNLVNSELVPDTIPLQMSWLSASKHASAPLSSPQVRTNESFGSFASTVTITPSALPTLRPHLLPTELLLSLTILRLSDLRSAIATRSRSSSITTAQTASHLEAHLEHRTTVQVIFDVKLVQRRVAEKVDDHTRADFTRILYRSRTSSLVATVTDGDQLFIENGGSRSAHTQILVQSELISSLADDALEIILFILCDQCDALHEVGTVHVPTAAVLFRPNGVRGTFPLRVNDAHVGAIDVHCLIDHSKGNSVKHSATISAIAATPQQAGSTEKDRESTKLLSPTSPEEMSAFSQGVTTTWIEVAIEEGRNILPIQIGKLVDDNAAFDVHASCAVLGGEDRGSRGVAAQPSSFRTASLVLSSSLHWKATESICMRSAIWQSSSLEVSLWQHPRESSRDSRQSEASVLAREGCSVDKEDRNDSCIGKAIVDLSLLGRRWLHVDGWYHILDGQGLSRGQVKVRVRVLRGQERPGDLVDPLSTLAGRRDGSSKSTRLPSSALNDGDTIPPKSQSLDVHDADESPSLLQDAMRSIHLATEEVHRRLQNLQSDPPASEDDECKSLPDSFAMDLRDLSLDTVEDVEESHEIGTNSPVVIDSDSREDVVDRVATNDDDATISILAHSVSSATALPKQNEQAEHSSEGSSVASLAVETGPFMPITLESLGIQEMELSPWSNDPDEVASQNDDIEDNAREGESDDSKLELGDGDFDDGGSHFGDSGDADVEGEDIAVHDRSNDSAEGETGVHYDPPDDDYAEGGGLDDLRSPEQDNTSDVGSNSVDAVLMNIDAVHDDLSDLSEPDDQTEAPVGCGESSDAEGIGADGVDVSTSQCELDDTTDETVDITRNDTSDRDSTDYHDDTNPVADDGTSLAIGAASESGSTRVEASVLSEKAVTLVDKAVQVDFPVAAPVATGLSDDSDSTRVRHDDTDIVTSASVAETSYCSESEEEEEQSQAASSSQGSTISPAIEPSPDANVQVMQPNETAPSRRSAGEDESDQTPVRTDAADVDEQLSAAVEVAPQDAGVSSRPPSTGPIVASAGDGEVRGEQPSDKLDLIVDLLNEILTVCSQRTVIQVPDRGVSEAHDAATQADENDIGLDSTKSVRVPSTCQTCQQNKDLKAGEDSVPAATDFAAPLSPRVAAAVDTCPCTPPASEWESRIVSRRLPTEVDAEWRESAPSVTFSTRSAVSPTRSPEYRVGSQSMPRAIAFEDHIADFRPTHQHLASAAVVGSAPWSPTDKTLRPRSSYSRKPRFPEDSETERIARIMQGSVAYWMTDDSSSDSLASDGDYLF